MQAERQASSIVVRFSGTIGEAQTYTYGGVAQLGEHLPCKQGVMGSNPIISTKWTAKQFRGS